MKTKTFNLDEFRKGDCKLTTSGGYEVLRIIELPELKNYPIIAILKNPKEGCEPFLTLYPNKEGKVVEDSESIYDLLIIEEEDEVDLTKCFLGDLCIMCNGATGVYLGANITPFLSETTHRINIWPERTNFNFKSNGKSEETPRQVVKIITKGE